MFDDEPQEETFELDNISDDPIQYENENNNYSMNFS